MTYLRMEEVPACLLCGTRGTSLYEGLRDRLYGVPGTFGFWHCPDCGFIWLNPRPIREDIPKVYENYYTHQAPETGEPDRSGTLRKFRDALRRLILEACYAYPSEDGRRLLRLVAGRALGVIPPLRARAAYGLEVLFPAWRGRGRLLDVGCGNGSYLSLMRTLGWDVAGVDVDPQAVAVCRARGLSVFPGTLEEASFPDGSFDVITMNHVIEHVSDPLALLRECYRILSPGGYVGIVTPNVKSLAHRLFREN
jgi:2-polyprenyl-3-methyl-5-hydroxy-6-metoxy-1,4-benzoquinol methylase